MPIVAEDIKFALSGGNINTDPDQSLGGEISNTLITSSELHNLFDLVTSSESQTGDTEYRCFYVKNTHGSLVLQNAAIYIQFQTPSVDTSAEIGLGTSVINGVEQTVPNENSQPSGVTFSALTGSPNAIAIGDITAGGHKAVWVKRVINPGSAAYNSDSLAVQVVGDTAA